MAAQPALYPRDYSDQQISDQIGHYMTVLRDDQYRINSVIQYMPLIQLGLSELDRRRQIAEVQVNRESATQQLAIGNQSLELGRQTKEIGDRQLKIGEYSAVAAVVSLVLSIVAIAFSVYSMRDDDVWQVEQTKKLEELQSTVASLKAPLDSLSSRDVDGPSIKAIQKQLEDGISVRLKTEQKPSAL